MRTPSSYKKSSSPAKKGSPAKTGFARRRAALPVSDLVAKLIDPACAKAGLASSNLILSWPDIVGHAFADCTQPERINWPRDQHGGGATLIVRVSGPKAIYLQHEEMQVLERINQFFGFAAVSRMKIVQAPLRPAREARLRKPDLPSLSPTQEDAVDNCIDGIESDDLKASLVRLGRGVLRSQIAKT